MIRFAPLNLGYGKRVQTKYTAAHSQILMAVYTCSYAGCLTLMACACSIGSAGSWDTFWHCRCACKAVGPCGETSLIPLACSTRSHESSTCHSVKFVCRALLGDRQGSWHISEAAYSSYGPHCMPLDLTLASKHLRISQVPFISRFV